MKETIVLKFLKENSEFLNLSAFKKMSIKIRQCMLMISYDTENISAISKCDFKEGLDILSGILSSNLSLANCPSILCWLW